MELEKLQILKMLEAGRISADEAATLLAALETGGSEGPTGTAAGHPEQMARQKNPWTGFWIYPLMAGAMVLLAGALVIGWVNVTGAGRGWLICLVCRCRPGS